MSSMSMTALEATKQKRTHVRWIVCGLMWAAIAINFIDRTTLAIATPHIMQDLSITTEEMGMVMSAFFLCYGECKIVCVNRYCMNLLYTPYWGKQR